jgi:predicted component of type VI protein secretion system
MARLRTSHGHILMLPPRRVSVGESAANEIPVRAGHGLASVHFRLQPWESGYFLEDAGSGLGTLVNGKPVSWAPLKDGDEITAGELRMTYESEEGGVIPESPVRPASTVPVVVAKSSIPAETPAPAAEQPPSWLPPEALQPPVPPWARPQPPPPANSKKAAVLTSVFLILLLAAGALWYFMRKWKTGG